MGVLGTTVKRDIAPYLKMVFPSWYLAQFDDESNDVVAAAKRSLSSALPSTEKVLLFCRTEVRYPILAFVVVVVIVGNEEKTHLAQGR